MTGEGKVFGPYVTLRTLGQGGMGVVYLAQHQVLNSLAVVKELLPEWTQHAEIVQRFINEARAAAGLRHRNIVRVHDCAQSPDGRWFIVLEYLEGGPLSRFIHSNGGPIDAARTVLILGQAANALETAHHAGIVHRDVKPDNIFLTQQDGNDHHVVLLDFGIAKLSEGRAGAQTRTGVGMGTPSYMAPEQLANAKDVDPRADVYALGVIAFEMLTGGYLPWGQDTAPVEIYRRQTSESPPDVRTIFPGVSPELAQVVTRALQCDPRARWASARDFALALAEATPSDGFAPPGSEILRVHAKELLELGAVDNTFGHRVSGSGAAAAPAWMKSRPGAGGGTPVPTPAHLSPAYVTGQPAAVTPSMRPMAAAAGGPSAASGTVWTPPAAVVVGQVTTLGGSAAQAVPQPRRRGRTALLAALGVAGVAGAIALAGRGAGDDPPQAASTSSATDGSSSSPPLQATVSITSDPPGAEISVDGQPRGTAPLHVTSEIGATVEIRAEVEGHTPAVRRHVVGTDPTPVRMGLVPIGEAPLATDAGIDATVDAGRRRPSVGAKPSPSRPATGTGAGSAPAGFDPDNVGGD